MLYLYAITDQSQKPLLSNSKFSTGALFSITYQNIAAVVNFTSEVEMPPTEANLWLHESIVEQLMAERTVLPVRFGTLLANEQVVRNILIERYKSFLSNIERLRGKVEISVRALWDTPTERKIPTYPLSALNSHETSGRAYLLGRLEGKRLHRAHRESGNALAQAAHTALAQKAEEHTLQILLTERTLFTAAYLIDAKQISVFLNHAEECNTFYPTLRFFCNGPWPAYHFVCNDTINADAKEYGNG